MAWASCALPCCNKELELDLSMDLGLRAQPRHPPASPVCVSIIFSIRRWLIRERGPGGILCADGEISKVGLFLRLPRVIFRPLTAPGEKTTIPGYVRTPLSP